MSILETFGIMLKLGYHTGDNATSNDTCLESIARQLKENLESFLLGSSIEALIAALEAASEATGEDLLVRFSQALTTRRRRGPRRLLRLDVDEDYLGIEGIPALLGLRLGIDNETRWSSWYYVLDKLFKKKAQIVQFMHEHKQILGDNRLTAADWNLLQKAYLFLQPFDGAILCAEGNKASLSQSLVLIDCLLSRYENEKRHYNAPETRDERMLHAIDMGWFIMDKYYTMTEDVPVYSAAFLLDPLKRDAYIKQNWPDR
ncbi:hypothetical protein LZL87_013931 [Fusarium oxysporum]|nr:hypothetical protein LZL87_013931 [Fusarium oxysporum]